MAEVHAAVNDFVVKLRRRQITGPAQTAKKTAELLRQLVSQQRIPPNNQADALLDCIRNVAPKLASANPSELTVANIIRRVLHIVREEDAKLRQASDSAEGDSPVDEEAGANASARRDAAESGSAAMAAAVSRQALLAPSLHNLLRMPSLQKQQQQQQSDATDDPKIREKRLKHAVIEGINDLLEEVDNCQDQLASQATDHIHQNQVIITLGRSPAMVQFLKEARRKRSFQAIVAEGFPSCGGHLLAKELSSFGVPVTLIPDSGLSAMMARANLALVTAHAVLANGGVVAPIGSLMMAMAAKRHAVPFVALVGMFQLSVQFPQNSPASLLNDTPSPSSLLSLQEVAEMEATATEGSQLEVSSPTLDYIPPELISLLVTDSGGHMPSYVHRLMAEYYHMEDHSLG